MSEKEKDEITVEEIKFCINLINGMTQRVAFYDAFPKKKDWKVESVDVEASRLLRKPRVSEYLAQKRQELEDQMFMSIQYKRAELRNIWEDQNNSLKDRLNAMKLDAQLASQLNQNIKLDGNVKMEHGISPEVSEALDKLFN